MKIIDISQELFSSKVYPGDPAPARKLVRSMPADPCDVTELSFCAHNGTHIDAPRHFIPDGATVDRLDPSIFFGNCTVAEFDGIIGENDILPVLETCAERLLLRGDCGLSEEAAHAVTASRVRLIGTESQSIGPMNAPAAVHLALLKRSVIPLEGLDLSLAPAGEYILSAFPLNLCGCEGAPVRAVLIQMTRDN